MREIKVHVAWGDFFEPIPTVVTTSEPIADAVTLATLLDEARVQVFGEESYMDLLEDLVFAYDCDCDPWPDPYLLPPRQPDGEWALQIWQKLREAVKVYAGLIKQKLREGYQFVHLVSAEEELQYRYDFKEDWWVYSFNNAVKRGEKRVPALVKFVMEKKVSKIVRD